MAQILIVSHKLPRTDTSIWKSAASAVGIGHQLHNLNDILNRWATVDNELHLESSDWTYQEVSRNPITN